jgi:hypothetical protein
MEARAMATEYQARVSTDSSGWIRLSMLRKDI